MLIRGRSTRVSQPTGPVEIDWTNPLTSGLGFNLCNFLRRDTAGDALITRTANLAQGTTTLGQGLSSAANAAFSAPQNLSGTNVITVALVFRQVNSTGLQVLVEHTANQNTNVGSCLAYIDAGNLEASISNGTGGYNAIRCTAPAVGRTTRIVIQFERIASVNKAVRVWYDGVEQATTQTFNGIIGDPFANSTTYFLGRGASSLFANGVIHDISIWRRYLSDAEIGAWTDSPWRVYRPAERRVWFSDVAGGGATIVTTSQASSWSVRNSATALQTGSWSVRNLAGTTQSGAWSVRNPASASQPGAWSIRNLVAATQAGAWSVLEPGNVSTTQSGAWSVRSLVATTQAGAFSVRNIASATQAGSWSVEEAGTASATQSSSWSVRNLVAATQPASWSVRNRASTTAPGAWSVRSVVQATQAGAWKVSVYAAALQGASWTVRNYAGAIQAGAWSVEEAGRVSTTAAAAWSVRNFATAAQSGAWSVAFDGSLIPVDETAYYRRIATAVLQGKVPEGASDVFLKIGRRSQFRGM